jgi:uncharacterized membrane protein
MNQPTTLRDGFRSRFVLWAALGVPIAAWTAHLSGTAALAHESCTRSNVTWIMHGITLGTALVCVICGLIGYVAYRRSPSGTEGAARRFLGGLIVAVAVVNLVLIVWEGSYTAVLSPCR